MADFSAFVQRTCCRKMYTFQANERARRCQVVPVLVKAANQVSSVVLLGSYRSVMVGGKNWTGHMTEVDPTTHHHRLLLSCCNEGDNTDSRGTNGSACKVLPGLPCFIERREKVGATNRVHGICTLLRRNYNKCLDPICRSINERALGGYDLVLLQYELCETVGWEWRTPGVLTVPPSQTCPAVESHPPSPPRIRLPEPPPHTTSEVK